MCPGCVQEKAPSPTHGNIDALTKNDKMAMIGTFDPCKPNEAYLHSTFKSLIISPLFSLGERNPSLYKMDVGELTIKLFDTELMVLKYLDRKDQHKNDKNQT